VISTYTRAQAIADGTLVDVTQWASDGPHGMRLSSLRSAFLKSKSLKRTPKGCQVDHRKPLAKGGKDEPSNMQLLCGDALKQKEATELK